MGRKHRVLLLVENLSVPADPRVWREAQSLTEFGYDVTVICPKGEQRDLEAYVYLQGIHIYRYHLNTTINKATDYIREYLMAMLMTFLISVKVLFRHGFDVIHAANPPDTFFALGLFYKLFGKKFIFDQHDLAPEVFAVRFRDRLKPLHRLMKFFEWCSYKTANLVITTNESQKRVAMSRGKCANEKVFVVRNGPDLRSFQPAEVDLSLKQGKAYSLAYVGVMGVQDGIDYALRALAILIHKRGRTDVGLTLIGNGDQFIPLQQLTVELQLQDYVHFTGWLQKEEMLRHLSVADIGLSPDPSNELNDHSTMLKTMEYMALGKPIVAFDLPETRHSAQEAALYARPNEIEDFANKIIQLLDDPQLRQEMGSFARRRIETTLSWQQTRLHLYTAYQVLLPGSGITPAKEALPAT